METRSLPEQLRLANAYVREAVTFVKYRRTRWAEWCLSRAYACLEVAA